MRRITTSITILPNTNRKSKANITKITESQYLSIALIASKIGAHAKCVSSSHKSEGTARIYEAFIVGEQEGDSEIKQSFVSRVALWRRKSIFGGAYMGRGMHRSHLRSIHREAYRLPIREFLYAYCKQHNVAAVFLGWRA